MANVFISHTGADIGWARQIHGWLSEVGHSVFLDVDQHDGVPVGIDWRRLLFDRLHGADAMVCVTSPAYLQSVWCAAEIGAAHALGTELLPVRVSSEPIDDRLLRLQQYVDAAADPTEARKRLQLRLAAIDGAGGWGWPDGKSPYPGLRPFDLGEHRVFFGRSREITQIAERLRSPDRAAAAILAVAGASGCGKSSLVRAGVLPRIAGEIYWLTLPPMLPGTDPLGNLARAMAAAIREHHIEFDVTSLRRDLERVGLKAVSTDLLLAAGADDQCKLLIIIDQLEELLTQTDPNERAALVEALAPALGGPVQVLATLRPEFLDAFATDPALSKIALRYHEIRPLTADALRDVIEKPANVAGLSFDEDLSVHLVTDTGGGEALPLLAFTLEQLAHGLKRGDQLTHQRYVDIGGVRGALQRQADTALAESCNRAGVTRDQVLAALLGLVTIDGEGRPTKRRADVRDLSSTVMDELKPFVDRRLLSTEAEGERTSVGVAHEAFLVNWRPLKEQIDAQQNALRARRVVENEAADWVQGGRVPGLLLQGGKLTKAVVDIGAELKPRDSVGHQTSGPKRRLTVPRLGSSQPRLVTRVELNDAGSEFLEASIRDDRSRRLRRTIQVVAVVMILVVIAATALLGFVQARAASARAEESAQQAIAARLRGHAADMLAQHKPGGDIQAFQELLAADALANQSDSSGLIDAVLSRISTGRITELATVPSAVAFSPGGHRLLTETITGEVRLYNTDTGDTRGQPVPIRLDGNAAPVFSADGHRFAGVDQNNAVQVWNADTGQVVGRPMTGSTGPVTNVAISRDGHRLASASSEDGTVRLWDADTGAVVGTLRGLAEMESVSSLTFSPVSDQLATGDLSGNVRFWDAETGDPVGPAWKDRPFDRGGGPADTLAFTPDGSTVASGNRDGRVWFWKASSGELLPDPLSGHTAEVTGLAFSPDGSRLASASADKTVRLWTPGSGVSTTLIGHTDGVLGVTFSSNDRLISVSTDGTLRWWNPDADRIPMGRNAGLLLPLSPDGHSVATATDPNQIGPVFRPDNMNTVRLLSADTGQPIGAPFATGHTGGVDHIVFSGDGRRLATAGWRQTSVQVWDLARGQLVRAPVNTPDIVTSVALSPDGQRLATGGGDGPRSGELSTVRIWDVDTGRLLTGPLEGPSGQTTELAFSPDGQRLASGTLAGYLQLWDANTGRPVGSSSDQLHRSPVTSVAFSPDGHRLASGSADHTVQLWNGDTGEPAGSPLVGHADSVGSVAFSPGGHHLLASSGGGTVRLWNADTGEAVAAELSVYPGGIFNVGFTSDGKRLVATGGHQELFHWPVAVTAEMLCDKLTANMSHEQWREWVSPDIGYITLCPGLPVPPD